MSGAQVLGLALVLVVALLAVDRSKGRLAQWLYTPQLRIRIPAKAWFGVAVRSNVVNFEDAKRRRELDATVRMSVPVLWQQGGRS